MIQDFLQPLEVNLYKGKTPWDKFQLGSQIYLNQNNDFDINDYNIALFSVKEDRGSTVNPGCAAAEKDIRKALYELYPHFEMPRIIDLGNIIQGNTLKDTQIAVKTVVSELIDKQIVPIIIGGGHDLTYGQYLAYEDRIEKINLLCVDERIDIREGDEIDSTSFLIHILLQEPNHLFRFSHIGHQLFYNDPKKTDLLETMNFDVLRLGEVKDDITATEPLFRDADMVSLDISSIQSSFAPGNAVTSPNGFNGEEICKLCRFAGYSNKVTSFGIYETNPIFDSNYQTAKQVSQMIWYFIEGYTKRKNDNPTENSNNHIKYMVSLTDVDETLVFWKSKTTNRWWLEMEHDGKKRLVPCNYSDYQNALQDELPDRWIKVYNRLG